MKKVDLDHQCNSIELLITLKQIIFNLTEENFLLSIDQTMKLYDSNFPYSLNFIISSLLYYSFCSMKNGINIILNYLEAIQTKEEEMNKNYPKIIDVFIQRISKIKSQETYYMLGKMIERSSNDTINFYSKYFAHIKYFNYCYNKDVEYNQIEKDIIEKYEKLSKNDWEHHKQLIKEGVNPNEIAKIIRNDEIDKLQEISSQTKFNFNQYIQPSIYERYTFINEESVSLIMYAAFFSSVKCFKYLLMNKANVYNIDKYAVAGGNEEIIHLCEQDHVMNGVYETAIKFHQNDIFKYFYEKQNVHLNLQALGRICIFSHNYEILLFLIENGMKIDSKKIKEAAGNGDLYIVKYFLQNNQIPNDILLYSSESGNFELVKYTLEQKGVDVNSKKYGETALMKATLNNDIELVKLLLEQEKIIVNDRDNNRNTAFMMAAENGYLEIIKLFLKQESTSIDAKNKDGETALMKATLNNHVEIVKLLLERKDIYLYNKDKNGKTALIMASEFGYKEIVKLLLEQDEIDINAADDQGNTSLIYASKFGFTEIVKMLLERKVSVNDSNDNNNEKTTFSPFLSPQALSSFQTNLRSLLGQIKIDVNAQNKDGYTAFIYASMNGYTEIIKLLIENKGIDINQKDNNGNTALIHASLNGVNKIVELLLEQGIDVNAQNKKGQTAIIAAATNLKTNIVKLLLADKRVDVNAKDNEGYTALMYASLRGYSFIVILLLEQEGIDINIKNNKGKTALDYAQSNGKTQIVKMLQEKGETIENASLKPSITQNQQTEQTNKSNLPSKIKIGTQTDKKPKNSPKLIVEMDFHNIYLFRIHSD